MSVTEIESLEGWNLLEKSQNSALIDVRTGAEFNFTGVVNLRKINQEPILLPWRNYPNMNIDNLFNDKLRNILQNRFLNQDNNKINLLFICRSGARSLEAAQSISKLNYKCYNITNGFEYKVGF